MESNINFDKRKYFQLLKEEKLLREQRRSFLGETSEKALEYLSSGIILECQIHYNRKDEYISLLAKYLNTDKTTRAAEIFRSEFSNLMRKDKKALALLQEEILQTGFQRLDTFSIDPESKDFTSLIEDIVSFCAFLTFYEENQDGITGITLDQFYEHIEETFFRMQPYSDVGNSTLDFSEDS